jgi:hypothetical protein
MRQQAAPSKKDQMRQLTAELKNLQMATRITQMLIQQMGQTVQRLDQDVGRAMGLLNDLQYRTLSMLELGSTPTAAVNAKADELKLKDYNEASDAEDLAKGNTPADVVASDSIVVVTSTAPNEKGIFRSKFKVSECGLPALSNALEGKKVGDKFQINLNGLDHEMEVLAIRTAPAPAEQTADATLPVDLNVKANVEAPQTVQ